MLTQIFAIICRAISEKIVVGQTNSAADWPERVPLSVRSLSQFCQVTIIADSDVNEKCRHIELFPKHVHSLCQYVQRR